MRRRLPTSTRHGLQTIRMENKMERITSRQNALITHIERLASDPSYRVQRGEFVCEGEKLLRAAESAVDAVRAAGTTEEPM